MPILRKAAPLFAHFPYALVLLMALSVAGSAQSLTTLVSFTSSDGIDPIGPIAQDASGNIYGTTLYGGSQNQGEVYKVTPDGTLTVLHNFCTQTNCADGGNPWGGLILASDGNFYGTTLGTVYRITPSGDLTTIYTFCSLPGCADGQLTYAPLLQASDGNFYGTAIYGGVAHQECGGTCGTIFKLTLAGVLTTLHDFTGRDGYYPTTGLVQGRDGNLYGTTTFGGAQGSGGLGTAFKVTTSGEFKLLHSFVASEGWHASLNLQASNGNFYGLAAYDGPNNDGSIFKMTASGVVTVLFGFDASTGTNPNSLLQAPNGIFYGTVPNGVNAVGAGTIFELTPSGSLTTLYKFCSQTNCTDGAAPSSLLRSADGGLHGATSAGGGNTCDIAGGTTSCGTVFSFKP